MKNLVWAILTCLLVFVFTTPGFCEKDNYVTGLVGLAMPMDSDLSASSLVGNDVSVSYDPGYIFGVALGRDFGNYRFEGELSYLYSELDELELTVPAFGLTANGSIDGDISLIVVLFNGYYEFFSHSGPLTPYLTAGLGLASADFSIGNRSEQQDAVTCFQVGAGLSYDFSETTAFEVKYRYLSTSDIELEGLDVEFESHCLLLGISRKF